MDSYFFYTRAIFLTIFRPSPAANWSAQIYFFTDQWNPQYRADCTIQWDWWSISRANSISIKCGRSDQAVSWNNRIRRSAVQWDFAFIGHLARNLCLYVANANFWTWHKSKRCHPTVKNSFSQNLWWSVCGYSLGKSGPSNQRNDSAKHRSILPGTQ